MVPAFYEDLKGEMTLEEWNVASKTVGAIAEIAKVQAHDPPEKRGTIGYE